MRRAVYISLLIGAIAAIGLYWVFYADNITPGKKASIKIPTGSTYDDVLRLLHENNVLLSELTFSLVSNFRHYPQQVKGGYYVFTPGMNNRQIINMLRYGLQTPVTLVIYNIRTKEEFAGLVGRTLELDSNKLLAKLNDRAFCKQFKLDTDNILTHFIVDNYQFYWNVPFEKFLDRMDTAYSHFWNEDRRLKARALNLSPTKVTILASIVEKEVIRDTELTTVAAVYLNRLKLRMPLQADPTLVFATRDFNARRITDYHKQFDSPYNTYKYAGLPPGPICMPHKKSIDAVLNATVCDYLYFCANPDMSGYSIFSKTFDQQMKTAAKYRKKLDEMGVHYHP